MNPVIFYETVKVKWYLNFWSDEKRKSRFKIIYKNRNKIILHGYFRSKNRMMIGRKKINMIQIPTMMSNHYWLFQKVNSTNKDLKSEAFVFDYHRSFLFHSLFLRLLPLFPCLVIHELSNYLISFIIKSSFSFLSWEGCNQSNNIFVTIEWHDLQCQQLKIYIFDILIF